MSFPRQKGLKRALAAEDKRLGLKAQRPLNTRQKGQVKRLVRGRTEMKYFYWPNPTTPLPAAPTQVTTTPALTGVPFDIAQGTADTQRVGDAIQWASSFSLKYTWTIGDSTNIVRMIIFQWRDVSSILPIPDPANILIVGPSNAIDVHSQYNHDYRKSYTILFDQTLNLIGDGTAGNFPFTIYTERSFFKKISLKKANKDVNYIGGGGQAKNRLFFIFVSDSSFGAGTHPLLSYSIKINFYDG